MKKSILFLAIVTMLTSCYRVSPDAGTESVLTEKPFLFGSGGVDDTPIKTGSEWVCATTDHTEFSLTPRKFTEPFANLITSDNINVDFNAYLIMQVQAGKTPTLLKNFGDDASWYGHNVEEQFRTFIRDRASQNSCFALCSDRVVLDSISTFVYSEMQGYLKKINMPVDVIQVVIGAVTPPKAVLDETVATAAQKQSILTQNARKDAEDARKAAEISKALADQAYQYQMKMSIGEYLQLRQLEMIEAKDNVSIILGNAVPTTSAK